MNEWKQRQQESLDAQKAVEKRIAEYRKLMKPTHVKLHHIPRWMVRLLAAAVRKAGRRYYRGDMHMAIHAMGFECVRFMDHWGSIERGTIFVSEPYPYVGMCGDVERFAELIGCEVIIGAVSEWNPPYTIRLEFREKREQMP